MNGKKRILSWIMAGCLFLMMTGCAQTGTGTVPSGESTQPESSVISQTSEEESSHSQEESSGTQSETGGESSEEKSRQETGKHETMLPDISSDDPGFSIAFSQNPLDAGYAAEAEDAATTREMLEISRKYRDLWKEEVDSAYQRLLSMVTGEAYDQIKKEQAQWVAQTPGILGSGEENGEGAGTTEILEQMNREMVYYRSRAATLYSQLYQLDPTFTFAYSE